MKTIAVSIIAAIIFSVTPAFAEHVFMTIEGQKQGKFRGEGREAQKQQQIPVAAVSHSIISPRDIQSGLPTGQRMHKPLVVTKAIGGASPQIFNALVTNENLKSVVLQFMGRGPRGEEIPYYTIKLTNANIASYDLRSSEVPKPGTNVPLPDYEEVAFTYQKIEVESLTSKIKAMDDWEARM